MKNQKIRRHGFQSRALQSTDCIPWILSLTTLVLFLVTYKMGTVILVSQSNPREESEIAKIGQPGHTESILNRRGGMVKGSRGQSWRTRCRGTVGGIWQAWGGQWDLSWDQITEKWGNCARDFVAMRREAMAWLLFILVLYWFVCSFLVAEKWNVKWFWKKI